MTCISLQFIALPAGIYTLDIEIIIVPERLDCTFTIRINNNVKACLHRFTVVDVWVDENANSWIYFENLKFIFLFELRTQIEQIYLSLPVITNTKQ